MPNCLKEKNHSMNEKNTPSRPWVYCDENRIYIAVKGHTKTPFFTNFDSNLLQILTSIQLATWYVYHQKRNKGYVDRLYCRVNGKIVSFSEIVWLYFAGKISINNLTQSILEGKKELSNDGLQIDHLYDNRYNNCKHNLVAVHKRLNARKGDIVTKINLPYFFFPFYVNGCIRVFCGDKARRIERRLSFKNPEQFVKFVKGFSKVVTNNGDMRGAPKNPQKTNCYLLMFHDNGLNEYKGQKNRIQETLCEDDTLYLPWDGDLTWIEKHDDIEDLLG